MRVWSNWFCEREYLLFSCWICWSLCSCVTFHFSMDLTSQRWLRRCTSLISGFVFTLQRIIYESLPSNNIHYDATWSGHGRELDMLVAVNGTSLSGSGTLTCFNFTPSNLSCFLSLYFSSRTHVDSKDSDQSFPKFFPPRRHLSVKSVSLKPWNDVRNVLKKKAYACRVTC